MVWQAFVPDTASSQLAVLDMAEKNKKKPQENGIVAKASVSQTKIESSPAPCQMCRCHILAASEAKNKAESL